MSHFSGGINKVKNISRRPLKNYLTSHCEERSDVAILYIFNELEIASHSFAMTEWPFFKGLK